MAVILMDGRVTANKKVYREKKKETLKFPQQKQKWGRRIYKQTQQSHIVKQDTRMKPESLGYELGLQSTSCVT